MKMLSGVLVNGTVTATNVPALEAKAQVYPSGSDFQAILASLRRRRYFADCVQVSATHDFLPIRNHVVSRTY